MGETAMRPVIGARTFCDASQLRPSKSLIFGHGTARALLVAVNQWREAMKARTHTFAVNVVVFVRTIPDRSETRRLKDQLIGAAWGLNGNWRAACRARTHKEFTSKLGIVVEEADEAEGALNVIYDSKMSTSPELTRLRNEAMQLRAIFTKASRTASQNEKRK
jgi:four helix bundle protein